MRPALCIVLTLALAGCDKAPEPRPKPPPAPPKPAAAPAPSAAAPSEPLPEVKTRFAAAERLVALGDVHGDLRATKAALALAGLIDDRDDWAGGSTVLVQTGDILDRGDDEQAILDLFDKLVAQAAAAGGAVHVLNGNHELMNAAGDFRYVTPGGFTDFADVPDLDLSAPAVASVPAAQRPRAAAFFPGGVYAKKLAERPVAIVVGDTVFAHGGVIPSDAAKIERINAEVAAWLAGQGTAGAAVVQRSDSPVWSRHFGDAPDESDCRLLDRSLDILKAKRMVVGHTIQKTISPACDEKVWRIDVGMAAHYGGKPEVLELTADGIKVLKE